MIAPKSVSKDFAQERSSLLCRARQRLLGVPLRLRQIVLEKTLKTDRCSCLQFLVDSPESFECGKQVTAVSLVSRHSWWQSHGLVSPGASEVDARP